VALRIIKFIGLKILELVALAGTIYYVLGWGVYHLGKWVKLHVFDFYPPRRVSYAYGWFDYWIEGAGICCLVAVVFIMICLLGMGLWLFIKKNWEWAGRK